MLHLPLSPPTSPHPYQRASLIPSAPSALQRLGFRPGPRWRAVAVFQITSGAADIKIVFIYWLLYALTVAQITTLLFGDNRACVDLCCSVASGMSVHFSPDSIWVMKKMKLTMKVSGEQHEHGVNTAGLMRWQAWSRLLRAIIYLHRWWGVHTNASWGVQRAGGDGGLSGREIGGRFNRRG